MRYFFAKSLIENQIRLFRLFPPFSLFQRIRLLDFPALIWNQLRTWKCQLFWHLSHKSLTHRVYQTNKSWKSFTQIEFQFISIRFDSESCKSKVIFGYSEIAPLCVFCPKLSLNPNSDVSSWWAAMKILLLASLRPLLPNKVFRPRVLEWRPFHEEINWNQNAPGSRLNVLISQT